jgi:hypothetical protein
MDVKYETPQVLIVEVEVEKGFALSIGVSYERANDEYDIM